MIKLIAVKGFLFASVLISLGQNAELNLEKTENNSLIYNQYSGKINLAVPSKKLDAIKLDLGAGTKEIVPSDDQVISVEAEVILSASKRTNAYKIVEKHLQLEFNRDGNTIVFTSLFDFEETDNEVSTGSFFAAPERKVNLKISIPKNLDVKIVDRSGDLEILNLTNNLVIHDGSGSININGTTGNLYMVDHSGDILMTNINSMNNADEYEIDIKDYSGKLTVNDANGQTKIEDNSGEINVTKLRGSLKLYDTSGAIYIKNVIGDSKIVDASGEINAEKIDGSIIISDTSGGIHINEVSKDVIVKRDGAGPIKTKNIGGVVKK